MVAGRTSDTKSVTGVGTTATSTALTGPANTFNEEDAGRLITGAGIPAAATLASVTSGTAAVLSAAATATATITATIGGTGVDSGQKYGFTGWSPETDAESESYTLAANNAGTVAPDRIVNPFTPNAQRSRG
jgi:hypothetical protein